METLVKKTFKMVKTCCVYKCRNRANSDAKSKNISFFRFPANKRKLQGGLGLLIEKIGSQIAMHTSVQNTLFVVGTAMIRVK
jgi:hypothetical protein